MGAILMASMVVAVPRVAGTTKGAPSRLFDFVSKSEPLWRSVNDGVMGGVSKGAVSRSKGVLTFAGQVKLENNGGFASTRSDTITNASSAQLVDRSAFAIRVRGDGSTYQFTVTADDSWFWAEITPPKTTTAKGASSKGASSKITSSKITSAKDQWTVISIPFSSLLPKTRFGEPIDGQSFDRQTVQSIGLLIANKRAEQFSIDVDWIEVR